MAFNFGTPKTITGFALPTSSTTISTSLAAGAGDAKPQNKPLTNLFGASSIPSSSGFSLASPAITAPKAAPTLSFGLITPATTTPASGLGFGISTTSSAPPTLSFGVSTTPSAASSLSLSTTSAPSVTPLQFSLSTPSTAATTSSSSFTPLFGTGTLGSGVSISSSVPSTSSTLKLTSSLSTAPPITASALPITTQQALVPSVTATAIPATSLPGSMNYGQLEDSINKWTIDLEEQGKFFINQAKQLNAWDSLLISNSDKILALNETIERVKQQQKQLDQELDFIMAQQNELEELSSPLEKQLADIPITDQNRFQMYQLSEIVDSQLKQMSEDLKEIVEHLNESNKCEDISDPVIQVSRILNAHMNSLQWIDRNTTQICSHLDQISKLHEMHKQNHLNL